MKTQHIQRKNINSYCRTCLSEVIKHSVAKGQKYNVYQTHELSKWISVFTSLEVNKNDAYPKFLCKQCYEKLYGFNEFRSLCIQSKWTLDGILGKIKTVSEKQISTATKKELVEENEFICKAENDIQDENIPNETKSPKNNSDIRGKKEVADDKTLIASVLINSEDMIELKDENDVAIKDNDINLDEKETFEYKNCSGKYMKGVQDDVQITNDCVEDGTHSVSDTETEEQDQNESLVADTESEELDHDKAKDIPKRRGRRKDGNSDAFVETTKKRETKFKCQYCTRWCMNQQNLDAHMRIHQGLKAFQCTQCHRGYTKASRLKAHINDMHQEVDVEITCSYEGCGKIFRRNGTYRAHYRKFHTDAQPPMTTYMCEQCGRTFKSITALREHRFKHASEEEYPYHCEQCGKRYTSQRTFKEHQMRHAGIKNFECPFCGMKKTTRNELRTHINYHTKEKQWHCPDCPSVFNSSANLGLHVRVVHKGIRRYACHYCEQSFGKAETLKHHEMRHTGEKPHACDVCGKRFIQVVALRTHLKTHNKMGEKISAKQQKVQQQLTSQQQVTLAQQQNLPSTEEVKSACLALVEDLSVA